MKKIAAHDSIDIFTPGDSRFSFLKSPYAAHKTFSAVDIYYGSFGGDAFSPVDGEIIDIRSYDTPTLFKNVNSKEYVIAIRQAPYVIKILHIKPEVSLNEKVSKGKKLGTFIKNGYFTFWNDPVMHVEVRKPDDYLRASNKLRLVPEIEWRGLSSSRSLELVCRVEEIKDNYSFLSTDYDICGKVRGFAMDEGFLDGYVSPDPKDGFFGIIKPGGSFYPEVTMLEITKGNREIKCAGIAFCLSFNEPRIKVIPLRYGDKPFSLGDHVSIKLGIRQVFS